MPKNILFLSVQSHLTKFCNANKQQDFMFAVRSKNGDKVLHSVTTNLEAVEQRKQRNLPFSATTEEGASLDVIFHRIYEKPTFIDYLRAGWQISLSIAIDYTFSNLPISDDTSLHYLRPD